MSKEITQSRAEYMKAYYQKNKKRASEYAKDRWKNDEDFRERSRVYNTEYKRVMRAIK